MMTTSSDRRSRPAYATRSSAQPPYSERGTLVAGAYATRYDADWAGDGGVVSTYIALTSEM